MSYDIELLDPVSKKVITVNSPHFMEGGTYQLGGSKEMWLNITQEKRKAHSFRCGMDSAFI